MQKKLFTIFLILSFLAVTMGCAEWSRTQKGAAVGGVGGGFIGNYMDKQAAEIERDIEGAKVERIGEGIKITFSSGILFDVDKSNLKDPYQGELSQLATILNKYEDTNILLAGHTDSTGSDEYNLGLSSRRAESKAAPTI